VPLRLEDDKESKSPVHVVCSDSFEQCLRMSSNAHVLGDYGLKLCTDHLNFLHLFLSACMGRSEVLKKKNQPTVECQDGGQPYAEKEESKCNITFREEEMCSQSTCIEERSKTIPESMQIQAHACQLLASAV
jgi:hypothetical protein